MKIGIVGAGVVGAYLACRLSSRYNVEIFDKKQKDDLGHDCAWLFHYSDLRNYCEKCKLDPVNYLEHVGRLFDFFGVPVTINDQITFNKHQFLLDLLMRVNGVHFESKISKNDLDDYDLVIDATGSSRNILPSVHKLEPNCFIHCYQLEVESHDLPNDFYVHPAGLGFLWAFPRRGNITRVGCGSFTTNPKKEVEGYLTNKNYKLLRICSGTIRVVPPSKSKPFLLVGQPNIVGVGECIGVVSPLTGEGIRSALRCADLFIDALESNLNVYGRGVLEKFNHVDQEFALLEALRHHQIQTLWRLLKISSPFGLKISKGAALKMLFDKNHLKNMQKTFSGMYL
ncbi:MAG: NAD(P)/FAD-dependent oxidoreductase [Candidatus Bathyarchaeota archaeon]|nr:NAD(P)/FAD-dependent oxidoreductase [Candidatus Bathyarchaeum sp.]